MTSDIFRAYWHFIIPSFILATGTACQELFLYGGGSPVAMSVYRDLFQEYTRRHENDILIKGEFVVADVHEVLEKLLHQEKSLLSFAVTRKRRFCDIAGFSLCFITFPVLYT
ncbi:unnamed protein product [Schistocephalus solidus]|uniref:Polysacc_synt_4 domain-containing protein n=1 Tax=Schistocephalus solidus TaxID=70667 RepID=A0A183TME1_SCHSO|nr:unnamed protein product [Schistocephalus solidus]